MNDADYQKQRIALRDTFIARGKALIAEWMRQAKALLEQFQRDNFKDSQKDETK